MDDRVRIFFKSNFSSDVVNKTIGYFLNLFPKPLRLIFVSHFKCLFILQFYLHTFKRDVVMYKRDFLSKLGIRLIGMDISRLTLEKHCIAKDHQMIMGSIKKP